MISPTHYVVDAPGYPGDVRFHHILALVVAVREDGMVRMGRAKLSGR